MSLKQTNFICALSGIAAKEEDLDEGYPEGWVTLTLNRRFINPKWDAIQYVKQGLVQQALEGIPLEQRDEQMMNIIIQVEAQFALLENQTPQHIDQEQTLYIADPDENEQIMEAYNQLRSMLGLPPETPAPIDEEPEIPNEDPVTTSEPVPNAVTEDQQEEIPAG